MAHELQGLQGRTAGRGGLDSLVQRRAAASVAGLLEPARVPLTTTEVGGLKSGGQYKRADSEAQRADAAAQRADAETDARQAQMIRAQAAEKRAEAAEAELRRLRSLLANEN